MYIYVSRIIENEYTQKFYFDKSTIFGEACKIVFVILQKFYVIFQKFYVSKSEYDFGVNIA